MFLHIFMRCSLFMWFIYGLLFAAVHLTYLPGFQTKRLTDICLLRLASKIVIIAQINMNLYKYIFINTREIQTKALYTSVQVFRWAASLPRLSPHTSFWFIVGNQWFNKQNFWISWRVVVKFLLHIWPKCAKASECSCQKDAWPKCSINFEYISCGFCR